MSKEPKEAPQTLDGSPDETLAPAGEDQAPEPVLTAWEQEIERFWQNVVLNVSTKVETPIHNFLHAEKEALKARLKQLL